MSTAKKITPRALEELVPYMSARRAGEKGQIWLNANEIPENQTVSLSLDNMNRYPDCQPRKLLEAYSQYSGQPVENILATRGADEGIDLLIRTFCEPGKDSIVTIGPTYGMYATSASVCRVNCRALSLSGDRIMETLSEYAREETCKLIFICRPNNPGGELISRKALTGLLQKSLGHTLVVVDEAYIEFCPEEEVSSMIEKYDNLVVLRTLSKAFGLAALRCGFVLAQKEVIARLQKIIAPYPLPAPVVDLAVKALGVEGVTGMRERVKEIQAIAASFTKEISAFSMVEKIHSCHANFVMVRFRDPVAIWNHLLEQGIVARNLSIPGELEGCIRFTIGTRAEMSCVINVLDKFVSAQAYREDIQP